MSRLTGNEVQDLMEAYNAVYTPQEPQELTEEQIWEEVENWVNSLLEEGYDLSEYTWEEMYESYLIEMGQRMTTGQMTAPKSAPTPTSRPQVAGGGMGGRRGGGSSPGGIKPSFQSSGGYGRYSPGSQQVKPTAPASSRPAPASSRPAPASSRPAPASSRPAPAPSATSKPITTAPSTTTPAAPARPSLASQAAELRQMRARSLERQGKPLSAATVSATAKPTVYQANNLDPFDVIKGHLLDEGYADTEEAALKIMANMSEEWKQSILQG